MMSAKTGLARGQSFRPRGAGTGLAWLTPGSRARTFPPSFPVELRNLWGRPGPSGGVAEWLKALVC